MQLQTLPGISLSVSSYKGILYLENLGGDQLKEPPCSIFKQNKKNQTKKILEGCDSTRALQSSPLHNPGGSTERDGWTEEILVSNIGYQVQASQLREANITTKSNKRPWPEGIY